MRRAVHAVFLDVLADVAIELVALVLPEVLGRHLIVPHGRVVVGTDPLSRHVLGALRILVHEEEAPAQGLRRVGAVHVAVHLVVHLEIPPDDVPRLLRNDQQADAQLRHDRHGFGRHGRGIRAAPEGIGGVRADVAPRLAGVLAAFDVALFEPLQDQFGVFHETVAALVLVDAEPVVLYLGEAAAEPEDHAPARHVVEQRDLFRHADRVVPWQDDDHRAQLGGRGLARHVGQELHRVWAHRVVGEVVLDGPDGVEAERLGPFGQAEFRLIDLGVRAGVVRVLKNRGISDVHGCLLR